MKPLILFIFFLSFLSKKVIDDHQLSFYYFFLIYILFQALIEQNQQQARQILIDNPLLTRSLFQVNHLFTLPCIILVARIFCCR